jgi:hypothetical protein
MKPTKTGEEINELQLGQGIGLVMSALRFGVGNVLERPRGGCRTRYRRVLRCQRKTCAQSPDMRSLSNSLALSGSDG